MFLGGNHGDFTVRVFRNDPNAQGHFTQVYFTGMTDLTWYANRIAFGDFDNECVQALCDVS